ncbi:MAG: putative nucleotide-diphospho-sugar transferase [Acinetobacter sp.]|uniref:putative nucleotide-diphospho-sugar transferase n=1 Tax=Acinetobacter sp. TaxID=472 RepID=UPI003D02289F
MLTVFSFHTNDYLYTRHAEILAASAKKFNINIDLTTVNRNDWQKIITFKPTFINQMRKKLEGPILFVDADAIILEDVRPYFSTIKEDIGVHYLNDTELLSGTIFINDTKNARELISEWQKLSLENPDVWDQKILQSLLDDWIAKGKISLNKIPIRYTQIFDLNPEAIPPAIEHLQASRDKRWLKNFQKKHHLKRIWMLSKFSKATKNIRLRHDSVNDRANQLAIDLQINLKELISDEI